MEIRKDSFISGAAKDVSQAGTKDSIDDVSFGTLAREANSVDNMVAREADTASGSPSRKGIQDDFEHVLSSLLQEADKFEQEVLTPLKNNVMQNFLSEMETQFGVQPEKMVSALISLTPEDAARPPEENIEQIVEHLDLKADDVPKAETLMAQFLAQMQVFAPTVAKENATSAAGLSIMEGSSAKTLPNAVGPMTDSELILGASDKLAIAALGVAAVAKTPGDVAAPQASSSGFGIRERKEVPVGKNPTESIMSRGNSSGPLGNSVETRNLEPSLSGQHKQSMEPVAREPALTRIDDHLNEFTPARAEYSEARPNLEVANNGINTLVSSQDTSVGQVVSKANTVPPGISSNTAADIYANIKDAPRTDVKSRAIGKSSSKSMTAASGEAALKDVGVEPLKDLGVSSQVRGLSDAGSVGAGAVAVGSAAEERISNIQRLMDRTQFLVKGGGGEARVQLNPEGMGQVEIRVVVENGKVSVHMQAETKEARQLIQSSVAQIRSNIESQALVVDRIAVDQRAPTGVSQSQGEGLSQNQDRNQWNGNNPDFQRNPGLMYQQQNQQQPRQRPLADSDADENVSRNQGGREGVREVGAASPVARQGALGSARGGRGQRLSRIA